MSKSPKRSGSEAKSAAIHDQKLPRGEGGELHQISRKRCAGTDHGAGRSRFPTIRTRSRSARAGRPCWRIFISAKRSSISTTSAFRNGSFTPAATVRTAFSKTTSRCTKYTRADLFQRAGERTPAFVRFSTVAGNKGSFDLARDVRGFAVKLYTQEGNWDIVGNNIPVFFIQDAIKFPDLDSCGKGRAGPASRRRNPRTTISGISSA